MKQFIIINGTEHKIVDCKDITEARHVAINTSDLSKDTVVRELNRKVYDVMDVERILLEYGQMNGINFFTTSELDKFSKDIEDLLSR